NPFGVGLCWWACVWGASWPRGAGATLGGYFRYAGRLSRPPRYRQAELVGADSGYEQLVAQVVGLVEDPSRGATLPLDIRGTAFQQRVWQALQQIPRGQTASYAEIAARIGAPRSSRAVARACASNPLAVAVPCHRVVRRDGDLSGYAWGVARKRELLRREKVANG
ncbi:methylated-DNA--[protein]-cysteine S-methyltransferase, partial [Stenotrophomonas maltophilia]|uniref:methylated-DNA--[protein]-cysteine S-methyltransferase n=1 Tax=Stenotrophomonas maltophilia TaxID=40324 RepID=UPI003D18ED40